MRISSFRIKNYKSYVDSGEVNFSPGFNIVVGQNNVGKTALLEALNMGFTGKPHRSLETAPTPASLLNPLTSAVVTLSVTGQELNDVLLLTNEQLYLPVPADREKGEGELLNELLSQAEINFTFGLVAPQGGTPSLEATPFPSFATYPCTGQLGSWRCAAFSVATDRSGFVSQGVNNVAEANQIGRWVFALLPQKIYSFVAERLNVGSCPFGYNTVLAANASNLPEVLFMLQTNPERFARFNGFVSEIFPSIYRVLARPKKSAANTLELVVWMEDPKTERDDLTIELAESGTGVGQVLAILYVAISQNYSQTIIIDEPNSFLHPGAARKLIEILKNNFPQHQYIVSTHSPEIIKVANPETLTLIRWKKPKSVLEQLDAKQVISAQRCLTEVGARLSDVFGADTILWVEGQTEEACFQLVIDRLAHHPLLGLVIAPVRATSDMEGKRPSAKMVWEIYSNLSKGNALVPSAIAFIFDQESRSPKEREDLVKRSGGRLRFLPRRMYENYLLQPDALFAVMSELSTFQQEPVTEAAIRQWLIEHGGKKDYLDIPVEQVNLDDRAWLEKVHGAKLLQRLFEDISGSKERFDKVQHSTLLTEWLIENKQEYLVELKEFLMDLLESQKSIRQ